MKRIGLPIEGAVGVILIAILNKKFDKKMVEIIKFHIRGGNNEEVVQSSSPDPKDSKVYYSRGQQALARLYAIASGTRCA